MTQDQRQLQIAVTIDEVLREAEAEEKSTYFHYCLLAFLGAALMISGHIYRERDILSRPIKTRPDVVIVERIEPFRYTFYQPGSPDCFVHKICRDRAEPDFKPRKILSQMVYLNLDDVLDCWSLDNEKHAGYWEAIDKEKNPAFWKGTFPNTERCRPLKPELTGGE